MPWTNFGKSKLLGPCGGVPTTFPVNWHIGITSTDPGPTGIFTGEFAIGVNGYTRVSVANDIAGAYIPVGSGKVALTFVGAARSLRDQVLPISFKAQGEGLNQLAVGQPVRVIVQTRSQVKGISVPAVALMKNPSNQQIVWIKTAPERFEPRVVTVAPLDGASVAVTAGLKAGERVVTDGAGLLNQIR